MNWKNIASLLKISEKSLYRHRVRLGLMNNNYITDGELRAIILSILSNTPYSGEVYVIGGLRAKNVRVPRWRIRQQLRIIDPVGRQLRRRHVIHRRIYDVKGPNYLWYVYMFV